MNQTQQQALEQIRQRAERGPSMGFRSETLTVDEAEARARRWAKTWIEYPLRLVLEDRLAHPGDCTCDDCRLF